MNFNKLIFKYFVFYPLVFIRGISFFVYKKSLEKSQYFTNDKLQSLQSKKLQKILKKAQQNNFYKEKITLKNKKYVFKDPEFFLKKEDLKKVLNNSKLNLWQKIIGFRKSSSGTTAKPIKILKSLDAMKHDLAATWRGYKFAGIDFGDKQARFWGISHNKKEKLKAHFIDFILNRKRINAFLISDKYFIEKTKELIKFNPDYFYGYSSVLVLYAKFIKESYSKTPFKLKSIITTAESLSKHEKNLLEKVFATKVFIEYGAGELGVLAFTCEHNNLHINEENFLIELLDENKKIIQTGKGQALVTDLTNQATKTLRYNLGDTLEIVQKKCKCSRNLKVISNIFGRNYDFLRNKNGQIFHGLFIGYISLELAKNNIKIGGIKIIQTKIDALKAKIILENLAQKNICKKFFLEIMQHKFDQKIKIDFHFVKKIKREKSGKIRTIKSEIQ